MTNYVVYSIPKKIIPRLPSPKEWEKYDEEFTRGDIELDNYILQDILLHNEIKVPFNKDYTVHRGIYNVNNEYEIEQHVDSSKYTLIVYLDKDPNITDEFWVSHKKVQESFWSEDKEKYKCIIFWDNIPHKGNIFGKGKREILCFFWD